MRGLLGPSRPEPFQVSNLLGLTSLLCHASGPMEQDRLYAMLPSMSALETLVLILLNGQLPPLLPANLRMIRYILQFSNSLSSEELQHVAAACLLPELQSVSLHKRYSWTPSELRALQKIKKESKIEVIVVDYWVDEDSIFLGR